MHKRVKKLKKEGRLETRKEGRFVMVNVAEYDLAVDQHGDAVAEQAVKTVAESSSESLRDAQATKAHYDADLARLKLERETGLVRPIAEIEEAGVQVANTVLRSLQKLVVMSDDIVRKSGGTDTKSGRIAARKIIDEIRENIVEDLVALEQFEGSSSSTNIKKQAELRVQ